jgi:hypothetical protein
MTFELMPRLARLTKVHGLILDGNDLAVQCATNTVDRADLKIPILQALKLCDFLSRLPYSVTLDTNEYSVTYTPMSHLAQLTGVHGMVVSGSDVMVQCATATEEWTDIAIPLEQALTLREKFSSLIASFAFHKKGEPERIIRFVRPVSRGSILEILRFRYRANRYMQALSKEEFNQRFNDVWIPAVHQVREICSSAFETSSCSPTDDISLRTGQMKAQSCEQMLQNTSISQQLFLIETNSPETPEAGGNVSRSDSANDRSSGLGDSQHEDATPGQVERCQKAALKRAPTVLAGALGKSAAGRASRAIRSMPESVLPRVVEVRLSTGKVAQSKLLAMNLQPVTAAV